MDATDLTVQESIVPGGVLTGGSVAPEGVSILIEKGDGPYVITDQDVKYIDYKLGSGPMLVGHAHPNVIERLKDRVEKGTTFYAPNRYAYKLGQRIVDAVPCADAISYVSTGTEATYLALRLARAHTDNEKVLKFVGAYHGWHDEALISSNRAGDRVLSTEPPEGTVDTAGSTPGTDNNVVVAPFNDLERTAEIIAEHADDLAAVITEPMMRTITPKDDFLKGLREICDEHGIVLIFDEIVTGFRLAWGGAQERYDVVPDLATYGKVIGGGTPVGAVCGKQEIMDYVHPKRSPDKMGVETGGTLNGNPLGMIAGLSTLEILEEDGIYRDLNEYGDRLQSLFKDVLADSPICGIPIGEGPVVDYVITESDEVSDWRSYLTCDSETKTAIDTEMFDQNILKSVGGKMYISTEHGDEEFEATAEAFKKAVERVTR
jgi:glutamate-1-semialdehyde 2,1-aminomutase